MLSFYLSILESEQERLSFTAMYHAYSKEAMYVAFQQTRNQTMAEDALHNAFLEVIEKHREYLKLPGVELRPLLLRIVKSRAIDLVRKEHLSERLKTEIDDLASDARDLSVEIASAEGYQILMNCVGKLDHKYKITCELKYKSGKTNNEIAAILGIESDTVRQRVTRAHKMLRVMAAAEGYAYEP